MFNLPPSLLLNYLVSQPLPPDTLRSYPLARVQPPGLQLPTNGPGPPDSFHKPIPFYGASQLKVNLPFGNGSGDTESASRMEEFLLPTDLPLREGASSDVYPVQGRPHSAPPSLSPISQPKSILEGLTMSSASTLKELISTMSSNIVSVPVEQESGKTTSIGILRENFQINTNFVSLPTLGNILLSSCPGKKGLQDIMSGD